MSEQAVLLDLLLLLGIWVCVAQVFRYAVAIANRILVSIFPDG